MIDDGGDYARSPYVLHHVPHYYGDVVRQIFIVCAALMLIGAPFYADWLAAELPFEIVGALALVALAALANPHNKGALFGNAVASGVGLVIYETWALFEYTNSSWLQFTLRQLLALFFLAAFYFSIKTVRALLLHQFGKHDGAGEGVGEFDEEEIGEDSPYSQKAPVQAQTATRSEPFDPWVRHKTSIKKVQNEDGPIKLRCEIDEEEEEDADEEDTEEIAGGKDDKGEEEEEAEA